MHLTKRYSNIWTALLPFLLFLFYTFEVYTMPMDNAIEKTCLIVLALACVCSFGSSTLFHWFGCVDEWYSQLIRFDIAMIAVLICGSFNLFVETLVLLTFFFKKVHIILQCTTLFIAKNTFFTFICPLLRCFAWLALFVSCFQSLQWKNIAFTECLHFQAQQVCLLHGHKILTLCNKLSAWFQWSTLFGA